MGGDVEVDWGWGGLSGARLQCVYIANGQVEVF